MSAESDLIERALGVFVGGFCFTRSFTHPFMAERVRDEPALWVMRDGERKSGDYRTEEWVTHRVEPREVDRIARAGARGRFAICALYGVGEADAGMAVRAAYKGLGYRLRTTEPLMVHGLGRIPRFDAPEGVAIERVLSQELADRLAKAAKARQILPEHLRDDAPLRQYVALVAGTVVGWVRSITVKELRGKAVGEVATWCSNMHVLREHRRRGIARALLSRMLREDRAHGAGMNVLLSSHTGAMLYPVLGYRQIGTLLVLSPKKG